MADVLSGVDALNALNQSDNGEGAEFAKFSSGTTYVVKVIGPADLISFYSYGIYKKVNSFVAERPSKKSKNGYPVDNLTPWDKAWRYHKDLSEDFNDHHGQEAGKYRPKQRFAMAFFDLDSGKPIIVDLSKKQGQAVYATINENKDKLDKMTFKLAKKGEGTNTTVSLTPYINVANVQKMKDAGIDVDEDLTETQHKNFAEAPEKMPADLFEGLLYELNEDEQIKLLDEAGFDVSLIGLEVPAEDDEAKPIGPGSGESGDITDDDLPF